MAHYKAKFKTLSEGKYKLIELKNTPCLHFLGEMAWSGKKLHPKEAKFYIGSILTQEQFNDIENENIHHYVSGAWEYVFV
jgi:hypothetical protein